METIVQKKIRVWETIETVTILTGDSAGSYRIIWHRIDGPEEEFHVTPSEGDTVEDAVRNDLRNRMGP